MNEAQRRALAVVPWSVRKKQGRPSLYTEELGEEICDRIACGETVIEICRDAHVPSEPTVRGWVLADKCGEAEGKPYQGFSAKYARAQQHHIEHEMEELRLIGDTPVRGEVTTVKGVLDDQGNLKEVTEVKYEDMLGHRRLQVDARKWRIAKIGWRFYGVKPGGEPGGREGGGSDLSEGTTVTVRGGLPDEND